MNYELFDHYIGYNADNGDFFWNVSPCNSVAAGRKAGSINKDGYLEVKLKGVKYAAHRIAWFLYYGFEASKDLDHINHDRTDNRIDNLREVTKSENSRNASKRVDNSSGFTGVAWIKRNRKWHAKIWLFGKYKHLGYHTTIVDAVCARIKANRVNNFHENHGG